MDYPSAAQSSKASLPRSNAVQGESFTSLPLSHPKIQFSFPAFWLTTKKCGRLAIFSIRIAAITLIYIQIESRLTQPADQKSDRICHETISHQ